MADESDKSKSVDTESGDATKDAHESEAAVPSDKRISEPPSTTAETPEARAKLAEIAKQSDESAKHEALAKAEAARIASAVTPAAAETGTLPLPKPWGAPVARVDALLTTVEERLLLGVLLAEIGVLMVWVALRGFALPETDSRNLVIRIPLVMALFAGVTGAVGTRLWTSTDPKRKLAPPIAAALGVIVAILTRGAGSEYVQNALNWVQNASVLMLVGGMRGLVTRLTLWLALLGASLATAKGKHINIDVVMRFMPKQFRVPLALVGWLTAALMCVTGAWGFVDQLALGEFRVERTEVCPGAQVVPDGPAPPQCEVGPGVKLAGVREEAGRDLFLLGRQISLDLRTLPKVIAGQAYDQWLTPAAWNEWWKDGHWEDHYKREDVDAQILALDGDPRIPAITIPGGEENPSGILIRDLNLVLPFGLFIIALRFLIRSLLALSGHVVVDPDAAHAEDDDIAHGVPQPQTAPNEVPDTTEVL